VPMLFLQQDCPFHALQQNSSNTTVCMRSFLATSLVVCLSGRSKLPHVFNLEKRSDASGR
jgi:hypothetical protein